MSEFSPFLKWVIIPLYVPIAFCLIIHLLVDIWGFFPHVGAIVNNAAVNIAMQIAESLYLIYLGL